MSPYYASLNNGAGTVFRITTNGWFNALVSFDGYTFYSGGRETGLALGPDGNFYGTTYYGGNNHNGAVFKVTTNGALTLLYSFTATVGNTNLDGDGPLAGLTLGLDGNLYGTTYGGGTSGYGTTFQVTTNGVLTSMCSFAWDSGGVSVDSGLALGWDGNLYGVTGQGGINHLGTIFKVATNGILTKLTDCAFNNGQNPYGLTLGPDGNFYGTSSGGNNDNGTIFQVTTNGAITSLYAFSDINYNNNPYPYTNSDGYYPDTRLTLGPDGNFYGTTQYGGANGYGTVFQVTTNGALTTLHSFATVYTVNGVSSNYDGAGPGAGGLVFGPDGKLYGVTQNGGANGQGTVFQITTNGVLAVLANFGNTTGVGSSGLIVGPDGNFYGTTLYGGANGYGTVFQVTTNGALTTLYAFSSPLNNGLNRLTNSDGFSPSAGLILGSDDSLYGTAAQGGVYGGGTIFKMTTNGVFTVLASFIGTSGYAGPNGLTLGTDGNFYATQFGGGSGGGGVIYRVSPFSTVTTVNGGIQNYGAQLVLGTNSGNGQLQVVNAGQFQSAGAILGGSGVGNNSAVVSGVGSVWTSTSDVIVGQTGSGNQLSVNNGGTLVVNGNLTVGSSSSLNNLVQINNGTLVVTNSSGTGTLTINNGNLLFNGGTLIVNELIITNAGGSITFSGGVLQVTTAVVSNGVAFTIGDGTDSATYTLEGGTNFFESGFTVAANATINGNGTVVSPAGIAVYGTASPGHSPGQLVLNGNVSLHGIAYMEIDKTAHTNDLITGVGQLTFGGILQVSLLNGTTLTNGDSFKMFSASNYVGTFATITPATPGPGLIWNNQTLNNSGVLSVVALPQLAAQFAANPTNAPVGASVQFTGPSVDSGNNSINHWSWNFGDGGSSSAQNPPHVYTAVGSFTPALIVTNSLGLALAATGPAITITGNEVVTNTADNSGPGTLRTAIANATNGAVITFAPNLSGQTILLASTLNITTNLTIDASALTNGIQISGNHGCRIFNVPAGNASVLTALKLVNGNGSGTDGGAIFNQGSLTLNQCTVSGNSVSNNAGIYGGGGICNLGTLTVNSSTFSSNSVWASSLSQFGVNDPNGYGGGGAIYNAGTLTVNQCTLSGNFLNDSDGSGTVFLSGGGILGNEGTMVVNQSTLAGNWVNDPSAGAFATPEVGGLENFGNLTLNNTIVAANSGELTSNPNLDSGSPITGANNLTTGNPQLAPLGNYGGPTQTMPPLLGSPVIGAGSVAGNVFTTDQRGYPRTQNGLIDIGAVELPTIQFTATVTNTPLDVSVQFTNSGVDSDGSSITQWNWNFGDGTTGTAQNPIHVYADDGVYIPALLATNSFGLVLSNSGPAITITGNELVTTTNDSGYGSLRSAINNAFSGVTITFATNLSGQTILLASTLTITTNLTIDASALTNSIQINGNGAVQVFNVFSGNTVIMNSLTITNGYAGNGSGGGIANAGKLAITKCLISGNSCSDGGGINNYGILTVNQCTVSGNIAFGYGGYNAYGGGVFNVGTLSVNQSTLSGNNSAANNAAYGGGIYNGGTMTNFNSIIAGNTASAGADIYNDGHSEESSYPGSDFLKGANIIQSVYNSGSITGSTPINAAPNLAPLGKYGGSTQTMPPVPGSPAIGAGSTNGNSYTTDQRGYPRMQNGLIDIGAVELPTVQPFTANPTIGLVPLTVQLNATNVDSDGSAITQWNWTFGDSGTSTAQNPAHVYATTGTFTPTLIVTNSLGLTLAAAGPVINSYLLTVQYTANPTNGYAPLTVQFTCAGLDSSNNVIAHWHWNFGDNTTASSNQSPAHVYGSAGGYAPVVVVTNNLGLVIYATGPAISVVPLPTLKSSPLSKTNLIFTGSNGIAGRTNYVLMSTNLTLPRSQWTPVATNVWSGNGSFTFTLTNVVSPTVPRRFYLLQMP
jgi:uncharacterized repeat protein (TIGR03803 family)